MNSYLLLYYPDFYHHAHLHCTHPPCKKTKTQNMQMHIKVDVQ